MVMRLRTLIVLLMLAAPPAFAASIQFVPVTPLTGLSQGHEIALQIVFDFTDVVDADGTPVGTLGGAFDLVYDPLVLSFTGLDYNVVGDPAFGRQPDIFSGYLQSWAVGSFDGVIGPHILGEVRFEVLADDDFSSLVFLRDGNGLAGPFVNASDFVTIIDVDYGSATVTSVPVPAAIVLLVPALFTLGLVSRTGSDLKT